MAQSNANTKTANEVTYSVNAIATRDNDKGEGIRWVCVLIDSTGQPVGTMQTQHPKVDGLTIQKVWEGKNRKQEVIDAGLIHWPQADLDWQHEAKVEYEEKLAKVKAAKADIEAKWKLKNDARRVAREQGMSIEDATKLLETATKAATALDKGDDDNIDIFAE